ncbi:MAG: hypothetical protein AABZ31_10885 [Bdellovibrionota bacterium]
MRNLINQKKTLCGLPEQTWTDDPISKGAPVKKIHIDEMRAAVDASYAAKSQPLPSYTDDPIVAKATPIKAIHWLELSTLNAALSCNNVIIKCSDLSPNPMIKPMGWGTPAMTAAGIISASFVSPVTGPITIPVVVSTLRESLGTCTLVNVMVRESGVPVGGSTFPHPAWPSYIAKCVMKGGSGFSSMTHNVVFNAIMGHAYQVDFGYRKVALPAPNHNAWSWSDCQP